MISMVEVRVVLPGEFGRAQMPLQSSFKAALAPFKPGSALSLSFHTPGPRDYAL